MKMTLEQVLEYVGKYNGMAFDPNTFELDAQNKLVALLKRFGFKHCKSWISGGSTVYTAWGFTEYALPTGDGTYTLVRIGRTSKKLLKGSSKRGEGYFYGIGEVEYNVTLSLNPKTGEAWKIGDIDDSNPNYTTTLTKHGWWSGD